MVLEKSGRRLNVDNLLVILGLPYAVQKVNLHVLSDSCWLTMTLTRVILIPGQPGRRAEEQLDVPDAEGDGAAGDGGVPARPKEDRRPAPSAHRRGPH